MTPQRPSQDTAYDFYCEDRELIPTRCYGVVEHMIPCRLCCCTGCAHSEGAEGARRP